jgi:hypothetical protein
MRRSVLFICFLLSCTVVFGQPASFTSKGIGGGGALFAPSINPANHQELYFSCDMSELFHSTDFGETYKQVHFQNFIGGANSKVRFTNVSGLLYSISYINEIATPVKSTNNGLTWTVLPGTPDLSDDYYSIAVDYNNPSRIIITDYSHAFFSSNGGTTFTSFHTASSGSGIVIGGSFFDGSNIYLGTNDGVLTSANAGANWSVLALTGIPATDGIWSFAAAKASGITRFFCLTGNKGDIYAGMPGSDYYGFFKGIYAVDLGSSAWVSKNNGITTDTDFPMFIAMAENDIDIAYIAGSNTSGEPIVMKTTNAGSLWSHTFLKTNNSNIKTGWSGRGGDRDWGYGECPFGFEVASNDATLVIFTDFGFCHKTTDGGTSWAQAYLKKTGENPAGSNTPKKKNYSGTGLENTTCWQVHWNSATDMWASFSDIRGIRSNDGGTSWAFNYTGNDANSTYRVVKSTDGKMFAATSNIHDMYQSTRLADSPLDSNDPWGKILYSDNDGFTWQDLKVFNHPVFWIALDPNDPKRAYASVIHYNGGAGIGGVYRCDDLDKLTGATWTLLPNPPRTEKHPASLNVLNDGTLVASYSGRRNGSGFTPSSGVFVYTPAANTWADVSHTGMYYWTKDLVIDPNDASQNTWYACVFSGWGGAPNGLGGLYKTTNRGGSWTKLTGSLLDRVTSCTFNPKNANEIYLTTEGQGLYMSKNINAGSPTFSFVSAYPFRQPERVFFNPYNTNEMWVSSFGNGMKLGLMSDPALPVTLVSFQAAVKEKHISVQWETVSEQKFDHFELERSPDPKKGFTLLASPKRSETESGMYAYNDVNALPGITYFYRLKMIDLDQTSAYSKMVSAKISGESKVNIFPNPVKNKVTVSSETKITSVAILNSAGIMVANMKFNAGVTQIIDLQGLAKGFYILKIADSNGTVIQKKMVLE